MEKWEQDLDKLLDSGAFGFYKYCQVDRRKLKQYGTILRMCIFLSAIRRKRNLHCLKNLFLLEKVSSWLSLNTLCPQNVLENVFGMQ